VVGVSSSQTFQGFGPGAVAATASFKNTWDADIGVRFGLAYDRFFIYQKIGAIWGDHQVTTANLFGAATTTSGTATLPGLLWGIGLEYGLTPQWTAKVETDFVHYAATNMSVTCASTVAAAGCGGAANGTGILSENSFAVITKLGLNYRF
jgi:opacity protein-like surface antigen